LQRTSFGCVLGLSFSLSLCLSLPLSLSLAPAAHCPLIYRVATGSAGAVCWRRPGRRATRLPAYSFLCHLLSVSPSFLLLLSHSPLLLFLSPLPLSFLLTSFYLSPSRAAELETGLEERQIQAICRQMLEGIEHLHTNFIIHRDIKAGNALLSADGHVKLSALCVCVCVCVCVCLVWSGRCLCLCLSGVLVWLLVGLLVSMSGFSSPCNAHLLVCSLLTCSLSFLSVPSPFPFSLTTCHTHTHTHTHTHNTHNTHNTHTHTQTYTRVHTHTHTHTHTHAHTQRISECPR
jgi:hypothetical protein